MAPTNSITVHSATLNHVSGIITLERLCSTAAHWTEQQYQQLFQSGGTERLALVAEETFPSETNCAGNGIAGFLIARHVVSEWELENIVVNPAVRRRGLGRQLLEALLASAQQGASPVFLEVRESNAPARLLYQKAGFQQTGRRKSYYKNPQEAAILYRWSPG